MRSPRASGRSLRTGIDGRTSHDRRRAAPSRALHPLGGQRSCVSGERGGRMSALPGKRGLRWLLLVSASLSAIAVFLLATATSNTTLFATGYDTLLVVNGVLIGLLML